MTDEDNDVPPADVVDVINVPWIAAPLAVFPVAFLVWRWLTRDGRKPGAGGVILAGVITGSIPHYLTFLFAGIGMSVCHLVSNGCVDSMGNPPAGFVDMLLGAFGFTFFSLLMFGWISIPLAILAGFWVRTRE